MLSYPIAKDLVLVGGGHSHVIVLRKLGMRPVPGLRVTLISADWQTPYSGMLPGVVAGHYNAEDIHIDLEPLCRFAGANFIRARVSDIDTVASIVRLDGRPDQPYDAVSLDIGITPAIEDIAGAGSAAIAVKPISQLLAKWGAFEEVAAAGEISSVGFVGAGAGGVELCLAAHYRLSQMLPGNGISFHLFSDKDTILPDYPAKVQSLFMARLVSRQIAVHPNFRVMSIDEKTLTATSGQQIDVDETFLVTRAAPQRWLAHTGLRLDERGFVEVGATLQSRNRPNVFAAGDTAHMVDSPRPKAGVYAVRQGPVLHRNLVRYLLGESLKPFRPQKRFLSLITTGDRHAVAERDGFALAGGWVWRWKDWIDRRFMDRFNHLPEMKRQSRQGLLAEFDDQMQCGGCGSKVAGDLLHEALAELDIDAAQLDDAAIFEVPPGRIMLHTVDAFRRFIDDPWIFARIAVNHALSDIYAMGGVPVTALAVITLPYATASKTRDLLRQVLDGASRQLVADDVRLVGGHTSEGAELSLGFAVNGLGERAQLTTRDRAKVDDVLILTRPLGTGALFAADMQARARGAWIDTALEGMLQSNRLAAEILLRHDVHAMTDVTGFGLAGHLSGLLDASGVGARLAMDSLPVLPGTLDVMAEGITSTLHAGNRRSATNIRPFSHPKFEVLFDPQTAGGLLAAVPANQVAPVLEALRGNGYTEAVGIGSLIEAAQPEISVD